MARPISLIQQQILDYIAADETLGPLLTSTSKRAIYNLLSYVVAVAINILENLMDIYQAALEAIAASAAPASGSWLQAQILKFQYSADVPQIVQLINFAPQYPVVDSSLCIVSRCSITTNLANSVLIKVATGNPPAALSSDQLAALQSYVNVIGVAGVTYQVQSLSADLLYVNAQVFYQGQYGSGIQQAVITAINTFLSQLPFNGRMRISDLEEAIRQVPGVTDVLLMNVQARSATTTFGAGTFLVSANQVASRYWDTVAGYMIGENTGGNTFADTLIFIPE
jgi:hypothetical protein